MQGCRMWPLEGRQDEHQDHQEHEDHQGLPAIRDTWEGQGAFVVLVPLAVLVVLVSKYGACGAQPRPSR
jgi:hypothetical protein